MAGRMDSVGRAGARSAGPARGRPGRLLLAMGALLAGLGAVLLAWTYAPFFVNPAGPVPPTSAASAPAGDTATVATPAAGVTAATTTPPAKAPAAAGAARPVDGVRFILEVPAIGYSAFVYDGVSTAQLDTGPRHYPGTPWPGQPGNIGVAGHNTFWLGFANLHPGDEVRLVTERSIYVYRLGGSQVVAPDDRTVLEPSSDNRLTLTTCYPLWAGALATRRLIFPATQVEVLSATG